MARHSASAVTAAAPPDSAASPRRRSRGRTSSQTSSAVAAQAPSAASAWPSSGCSPGSEGAAPASGAWSSSTSTSAIANAARNGSDHSAMVRHQPGCVLAPSPRAREGVDRGDSAGRSSVPASTASTQPGSTFRLTATYDCGPCSGGSAGGVERTDEAKGRAAELAEPVHARRPRARAGRRAAATRRCPISGSPRSHPPAAGPVRRARAGARAARAGRARLPRRALSPNSSRTDAVAVRCSPMPPRRSSFDHAIRSGRGPSPRRGSTARSRLRSGRGPLRSRRTCARPRRRACCRRPRRAQASSPTGVP